jgi:transposase-like protein
MNLQNFQSRFNTHEACRAHLEALRWPHGVVCPRCNSIGQARRITTRPDIWRCACKREFRVTDGTPMEGSHLPLDTWFTAIYLISTSSKGISAMRLKDWLGVSYKTAWFLGHRIRQMLDDGSAVKLTGIVEADETYVGGRKRKGRDDDEDDDNHKPSHRGRGRARATVGVAVERGGKVKAERIASHGVKDIAPFLYRHVDLNSTVLMTDELPAYQWIGRRMLRHPTVRHGAGEYSRTDESSGLRVHSNTSESFNNLFKRAIIGAWHYVSSKHCTRYAIECGFR